MNRYFEDELRQAEQEFERMDDTLRRFLRAFLSPDRFWEPRADVYETRTAVKVKIELSGVRPDDLHVELAGDGRAIVVRGERKDDPGETGDRILFHQMEIYLGPFERLLPLPAEVEVDRDAMRATYRDGFLVITLPKRNRPQAAASRVQIK